jgi:hypothetical protein
MRMTPPKAWLLLSSLTFVPGLCLALDLEHHPGKAIYEKMCLDCHGAKGEGVKDKADDALVGSRTLDSLAQRIDRTMPEDKPELLNAEDSKIVAEYIYDAFYSAEARARNTPARIDLSRLTVPQYQNSVADLILSFRGDNWIPETRGLEGPLLRRPGPQRAQGIPRSEEARQIRAYRCHGEGRFRRRHPQARGGERVSPPSNSRSAGRA